MKGDVEFKCLGDVLNSGGDNSAMMKDKVEKL